MIVAGNIGYLASVCSLIFGVILMSDPGKAKKGNIILVVGMLLAILSTTIHYADFTANDVIVKVTAITLVTLVGILLGKNLSFRYNVTKMPELIALFNGLGGLAAAVISAASLLSIWERNVPTYELTLLLSSLFLGLSTFSASIIAKLKLSGQSQKAVNNSKMYMAWCFMFSMLFWTQIMLGIEVTHFVLTAILAIIFSLLTGYYFAKGVGGADMPVLIAVLNGITGVITTLSGIYFQSTIMILLGVIVGFTGIVLTIQMSNAMNRKLINIFFKNNLGDTSNNTDTSYENIKEISTVSIASDLLLSKKIAIVPGFGMAISHAQHTCKKLKDIMEANEAEVKFIIHPVAGRMPGHMNVLLAEAKINYDDILDLSEGNDYLNDCDYCIIIGANDTVNTSAETDQTSPIFGMPIIQAYKAEKVLVIKRSLSHGYAGVINPLLEAQNCYLLMSDANLGLNNILNDLNLSK